MLRAGIKKEGCPLGNPLGVYMSLSNIRCLTVMLCSPAHDPQHRQQDEKKLSHIGDPDGPLADYYDFICGGDDGNGDDGNGGKGDGGDDDDSDGGGGEGDNADEGSGEGDSEGDGGEGDADEGSGEGDGEGSGEGDDDGILRITSDTQGDKESAQREQCRQHLPLAELGPPQRDRTRNCFQTCFHGKPP